LPTRWRAVAGEAHMIIGIGVDLTQISRIESLLEKWGDRFAQRVFTEDERDYASNKGLPARHYAARFAAKEATLKALGTPTGARWHDMEVVGGGTRRPTLVLAGAVELAARELGVQSIHLTLTHEVDMACAVVIAEAA